MAGLPSDKLSASIVSFARFFSLPIKPELMAAIRHQALPSTMTMPSATAQSPETVTQNRETLSLAAAAAQDKGVELSPKGLETFAGTIDPDWQKRDSGRRNPHGRREREKKAGNTINDGETSSAAKAASYPMSASSLRDMILETAEKEPLLAILNKLPGKNGRRWIVLPFDLNESGREFRVSLRILLEGENPAESCPKRMVVDIVENCEGQSARRWLFVPVRKSPVSTGSAAGTDAISEGGTATATKDDVVTQLTLYLQPELPPKALALTARKLAQAMKMPLDCVFVRNLAEPFPGESDSANELFYAVDEAV
jgi:hypothetical protein